MALELTSWLVSLGISKEKADAIAPDLAPAQKAIEEGVLRQEDYSRKMGEINKLQADFEKNNTRLNEDIAEFAQMTADEQAGATALRNRIEVAERKAFDLTQKITRHAEAQGIDPKTILGDVEPAAEPTKAAAAAYDDSKLRGDINNTIGGVANYFLEIAGSIDDIAREHEELTGERFDRKKFIAGIKADIANKKTDNLDPVRRWEGMYGIPEKRTASAQKNREQEVAKAREEGRIEGLSQASLPGGSNTGSGDHNSPVFRTTNVTNGSVLKRPQPSTRLTGAIAALNSGKYRGDRKTA